MNRLIQEYNKIRIKGIESKIRLVNHIIYNSNVDEFLKPINKSDPRYNPCGELNSTLHNLLIKKDKINKIIQNEN